MSTDPHGAPPPLPDRPNLRHLKDQAKDLLKAGAAASITDAQFKIARLYGFASWPKLKAHIDSLEEIGQLKQAIDTNDIVSVKTMMELLVSHGADVNALWHGHFPIIFAPCESLDPAALKWLLDHGANPNCRDHGYKISGHSYPGTALDYLLGGYARSLERLSACIDVLLEAGGETKYNTQAVLALLRGRLDNLAELIDAEPGLVTKRFSELDCGQTGGRLLLLQGGTLLHVAAEYGNLAAAALLLDRGADVNAR